MHEGNKAFFLRGKGGTKFVLPSGGWYVDVPEPGVVPSSERFLYQPWSFQGSLSPLVDHEDQPSVGK